MATTLNYTLTPEEEVGLLAATEKSNAEQVPPTTLTPLEYLASCITGLLTFYVEQIIRDDEAAVAEAFRSADAITKEKFKALVPKK